MGKDNTALPSSIFLPGVKEVRAISLAADGGVLPKKQLTVVRKVDLEKLRERVDIKIKKKVVLISPILKRNKESNMIKVASQVAQKKDGDVIAPLQC
ncbi:hypothetical protein MRB53_026967 [Persea americana]|uniref:Uncharacterized protein n=1 Tax=Persea americana TaxID=3435 RepID=A0ACC2LJM0_PERAE|nr:hypothetical protein MRB53_026967 [Persea americana]